jgi:hypothetical protein
MHKSQGCTRISHNSGLSVQSRGASSHVHLTPCVAATREPRTFRSALGIPGCCGAAFAASTFRIRTANSAACSGSCDLPRLPSLPIRIGRNSFNSSGPATSETFSSCSIGRLFAARTSFDSFAACCTSWASRRMIRPALISPARSTLVPLRIWSANCRRRSDCSACSRVLGAFSAINREHDGQLRWECDEHGELGFPFPKAFREWAGLRTRNSSCFHSPN